MIGVLQTALPSTTARAASPPMRAVTPLSSRARRNTATGSAALCCSSTARRSAPTSRVVRLNYAQASELADVVRESMGGGGEGEGSTNGVTVVAEPQSNSLLITAPRERIEAIARAVQSLDVRPSQVLIEAVIFEISAENFSDLSVQFGGLLNQASAAAPRSRWTDARR